MSTRTVIEINHDYLSRLMKDPQPLYQLLRSMCSSDLTGALNEAKGAPVRMGNGIDVLGQRHHSETLKLEVK